MNEERILKVGIGGLGTIGTAVARALDNGIAGLELGAVSARDTERAARTIAGFEPMPQIVPLGELAAAADVVVECAPAAVYDEVARPAVAAGRILVTMSSGALLSRPELIERARKSGARILVPSGGILGLDALRAAAQGEIHSVVLITRKPPRSLAGAPYLVDHGIDLSALSDALKVFDGNAAEAARGFPANANVAATISLAGIGASRTRVEIWADPAIERNTQELHVRSAAADFSIKLASHPMPDNPRTGSLTPYSVISVLRALASEIVVGG